MKTEIQRELTEKLLLLYVFYILNEYDEQLIL